MIKKMVSEDEKERPSIFEVIAAFSESYIKRENTLGNEETSNSHNFRLKTATSLQEGSETFHFKTSKIENKTYLQVPNSSRKINT